MNRSPLPQLSAPRPFLADGGLETDLIFHHGLDLPEFASFVLLESDEGREALRRYLLPYLRLAREHETGLVVETPTWRANRDWGLILGYDADALDRLNREAIAFFRVLASEVPDVETVISGCVGPRGDGYEVGDAMSSPEAAAYHLAQVTSFAEAGANLASALTMTYVQEAIGFTRAAEAVGIPSVVSFTVETDGALPSGQPLADAIRQTDDATGGSPAYYMVNCAHPTHFAHVLDGGDWVQRIRGLRANASTCSHAELDEAETLDEGDPQALASDHVVLAASLPALAVVGGCCGTDVRHVSALAETLLSQPVG